MIKTVLAAASGAACFFLVAGSMSPAIAQGTFDCRRPSQPYQRVVCSDPGLKAADVRLSETLGEALSTIPNPDSLRSEQGEWTQNLRNCSSDVLCLRDFYTDRTSTLRRRISRSVEDQRVAEPVVEEVPAQRPAPPTPNTVEPVPVETPEQVSTPSPNESYAEPEYQSSVVDAQQAPATSVTTPLSGEIAAPSTTSPSPSLSIPPWVVIAAGISLFLMIGLSIHILNVSADRYGYDMLFNRMAPLHIVVAACVWLSFLVPLLFAPIALLTFSVILFNNIRRTNLVVGFVGSLIQPIALLLAFMGAKWLATALRPKR